MEIWTKDERRTQSVDLLPEIVPRIARANVSLTFKGYCKRLKRKEREGVQYCFKYTRGQQVQDSCHSSQKDIPAPSSQMKSDSKYLERESCCIFQCLRPLFPACFEELHYLDGGVISHSSIVCAYAGSIHGDEPLTNPAL